jgi:hypothetical protein
VTSLLHGEGLHGGGKGKNAASRSPVGRAAAGLIRPSFIISFAALLLSIANFYVTVYEQPILNIYAGCNWRYGRGMPGLGTDIEYFVIPVTIVNDGARTGTMLAIDLTVEKNGSTKSFPAGFIAGGLDDKAQQMFAPIAVAGHASASSSIVFIQLARTDPPVFANAGPFHASFGFRPSAPVSFRLRLIDRLSASPGTDRGFMPVAPAFDGRPVSFDVCAPVHPDASVAGAK